MYEEVKETLRVAYDQKVEERDSNGTQPWKVELRRCFLELLQSEGKSRLLEVGAGTGVHSEFFANAGLQVVATDLSPAMVEACRARGLEAWPMDFLSLGFDAESFDAVFSLNCFLHVPPTDLPAVIEAMHRVLKPEGLLYWGQYGGADHQGPLEADRYEPQRFFSLLSDDALKLADREFFRLHSFDVIEVSRTSKQLQHFQSSLWRRVLEEDR